MVKIAHFWDQNDVTGQKFDEKVENFFFQYLGEQKFRGRVPVCIFAKNAIFHAKMPKKCDFGRFPSFSHTKH